MTRATRRIAVFACVFAFVRVRVRVRVCMCVCAYARRQITEKDLSDQFYAYGELKNIQIVPQSNCAFVTYTTREAAEKAADKLHNNLIGTCAQTRPCTDEQ